MQEIPADGDWKRRQRSENLDIGSDETDLLVCLAQRGPGDRFVSSFQLSSLLRHLSRMVPHPLHANGQRHPPLLFVRIDEQERGSGSENGVGTGPRPRLRRQPHVRIATRKRLSQSSAQIVW
jgi:hypothetical protein